jgi:hypothetical protein
MRHDEKSNRGSCSNFSRILNSSRSINERYFLTNYSSNSARRQSYSDDGLGNNGKETTNYKNQTSSGSFCDHFIFIPGIRGTVSAGFNDLTISFIILLYFMK